jgi:hypothetical protein
MEIDLIPKKIKIESNFPHFILTLTNNNLRSFKILLNILIIISIAKISVDLGSNYPGFNDAYFFWYLLAIGIIFYQVWIDMWLGFGVTEIYLNSTELVVTKKLFRFSKTKQIDPLQIICLEQSKDELEQKFAWKLKIKLSNRHNKIDLVTLQSLEVSDWLSRLLADTYRIEVITVKHPFS